MNGVVKVMEYPNDQPRDLPHLPVQIEGLLWCVGKGGNTARACSGVLCFVFLWCFVIYCCGPDECQSFSTYVPPLTTLHSSSSTDLHRLRRNISSVTVMISLFLIFSPALYHSTNLHIIHPDMKRWREREESEGLRETREGWCRTPMGFLVKKYLDKIDCENLDF